MAGEIQRIAAPMLPLAEPGQLQAPDSLVVVQGDKVRRALPEQLAEMVRDTVATLFNAGAHTGITFAFDDAANKISATVTAAANSMPVTSKSGDYMLVIGDANSMIYHPASDATARTWTIPANSNVAFPVGTILTFDNAKGAGALTIAIASDTLELVGAGTTGSRALATGGRASAVKVEATKWRIEGSALT